MNGSTEYVDPLAGRVAVIVGGAGAIGRETAARLGAAGCRLALLDLEEAALQSAASGLDVEDGPLILAADITDRAQVDRAAELVRERFGQVDILVNSAGINTKERTLADMSAEQWERVVAVNLNGVFHCTQSFLPLLREGGGGIVVTISSGVARSASVGAGTHYCASKRALLSFTESINQEQGRHGIRACAICPGEVDTTFIDTRPEPPDAERRAMMLKAGDVAEAILWAVTRPARVTVDEIYIYPTAQISGVYTV
jgi:NAD(P)-dependent dehydrogenase (short-subunit alcohol dehydrogenase family)